MPGILAVSASGIGNTILFTPVLRALRDRFPDTRLDLACRHEAATEVVKGGSVVDESFVLPDPPVELFRLLKELRSREYRASVSAFPNVRPAYNLFAFAVGASKRVTHRYRHSEALTLGFLQNRRVRVAEEAHDIENNLALLRPFGIDAETVDPAPFVVLTKESDSSAQRYLSTHGIDESRWLLGVHAGSGPLKDKRWGVDNFAREIRALTRDKPSSVVMLFGSREELGLNRRLAGRLDDAKVLTPVTSFKTACSLVAHCDYFLSNDSALMHVAATLGIQQKAIFVASNPSRTRPWNPRAEVIVVGDPRRFGYPFRTIRPS